jgi:hypothetical protein
MICPKCSDILRITRTVLAGKAGKTQEASCEGCKTRFTCVTLIVQEADGYGNGAQAVASQLRRGLIGLDKDPS